MHSRSSPLRYVRERPLSYFWLLLNFYLDDTLGHDSATYIINHSDVRVVVCSLDNVKKLLSIAKACPNLKAIICMDVISRQSALHTWAKDRNIQLYDWKHIMNLGKSKKTKERPPKGSDLACICYTSGTTGHPKGAMLTHS